MIIIMATKEKNWLQILNFVYVANLATKFFCVGEPLATSCNILHGGSGLA